MLFSFYNLDKPNTDFRASLRSEHRKYLAQFSDRIAFAGPLLANDGLTPIGSLLVLEFDSLNSAYRFIHNEPYTKSGLYESIAIRPFRNLWQPYTGFPT